MNSNRNWENLLLGLVAVTVASSSLKTWVAAVAYVYSLIVDCAEQTVRASLSSSLAVLLVAMEGRLAVLLLVTAADFGGKKGDVTSALLTRALLLLLRSVLLFAALKEPIWLRSLTNRDRGFMVDDNLLVFVLLVE